MIEKEMKHMEITNERFSEIAKTMDECESCRFRFNEMCEKCTSCTPISSFSELMEFFGRLHKLAKAQEEGRLVELPCKVGEIVYSPDGSLGGSWSGTVKEIVITDDGITLYIQSGGGGFYERASNVRFSHTRTEALKEQEG